MPDLASFLRLTAEDLEELDLSHNKITITTADTQSWEEFLDSLTTCSALKKLQLSGNNIGGQASFEIFAKVYTRQYKDCLNSMRLSNLDIEASRDKDADGAASLDDKMINLALVETNGTRTASTCPTSITVSSRLRGLAVIHTISLSDASITNAASLWLSYILEAQTRIRHTLARLAEDVDAPADGGPSSIIYLPDKTLSATAEKMLSHFAIKPAASSGSEHSALKDTDTNGSTVKYTPSAHRFRKQNMHAMMLAQNRDASEQQHITAEELDSMRRKFQRAIIEDAGATSVELWRCALRMLNLVRCTMAGYQPISRFPALHARPASDPEHRLDTNAPAAHARKSTYASKLSEASSPTAESTLVIPGVSVKHMPPSASRQRTSRHDSAVSSSFTDAQAQLDTAQPPHNDPPMIGPLPAQAWEKVLTHLADPTGILSERQRRAIVAWGSNRDTLASEAEILGKPASVQIWHVLDGMDCLAYDDI